MPLPQSFQKKFLAATEKHIRALEKILKTYKTRLALIDKRRKDYLRVVREIEEQQKIEKVRSDIKGMKVRTRTKV